MDAGIAWFLVLFIVALAIAAPRFGVDSRDDGDRARRSGRDFGPPRPTPRTAPPRIPVPEQAPLLSADSAPRRPPAATAGSAPVAGPEEMEEISDGWSAFPVVDPDAPPVAANSIG